MRLHDGHHLPPSVLPESPNIRGRESTEEKPHFQAALVGGVTCKEVSWCHKAGGNVLMGTLGSTPAVFRTRTEPQVSMVFKEKNNQMGSDSKRASARLSVLQNFPSTQPTAGLYVCLLCWACLPLYSNLHSTPLPVPSEDLPAWHSGHLPSTSTSALAAIQL